LFPKVLLEWQLIEDPVDLDNKIRLSIICYNLLFLFSLVTISLAH